MSDPINTIFFSSTSEWREWLSEQYAGKNEVWVGFHKKKTGCPSLTWAEAVEQALCFGWIDGIRKPIDENRYAIRFTPRRPRSGWSKINTQIAERLMAEALMHPAGLKEIEKAKADGRWQAAYDSQASVTVPPDLQEALDANPVAKSFYETLSKRNSYAIQYRIQTAKRPDTRERRIREFVEMLARGERPYP